jgi:hypothetical protein
LEMDTQSSLSLSFKMTRAWSRGGGGTGIRGTGIFRLLSIMDGNRDWIVSSKVCTIYTIYLGFIEHNREEGPRGKPGDHPRVDGGRGRRSCPC